MKTKIMLLVAFILILGGLLQLVRTPKIKLPKGAKDTVGVLPVIEVADDGKSRFETASEILIKYELDKRKWDAIEQENAPIRRQSCTDTVTSYCNWYFNKISEEEREKRSFETKPKFDNYQSCADKAYEVCNKRLDGYANCSDLNYWGLGFFTCWADWE